MTGKAQKNIRLTTHVVAEVKQFLEFVSDRKGLTMSGAMNLLVSSILSGDAKTLESLAEAFNDENPDQVKRGSF